MKSQWKQKQDSSGTFSTFKDTYELYNSVEQQTEILGGGK